MSDNKERRKAGFSWQIGLLIVFYLVILGLPFLNAGHPWPTLFKRSITFNLSFSKRGFYLLGKRF